jgi:hypothetical protein
MDKSMIENQLRNAIKNHESKIFTIIYFYNALFSITLVLVCVFIFNPTTTQAIIFILSVSTINYAMLFYLLNCMSSIQTKRNEIFMEELKRLDKLGDGE